MRSNVLSKYCSSHLTLVVNTHTQALYALPQYGRDLDLAITTLNKYIISQANEIANRFMDIITAAMLAFYSLGLRVFPT